MTADLAVWLTAQLDADAYCAEVEAQFRDRDPYFSDPGEASSFERRLDPAFVLDWVAAQRKIVELHHPTDSSISVREDGRWVRRAICRECAGQMLPCGTLLALARPFRGRPGWRDEWETS